GGSMKLGMIGLGRMGLNMGVRMQRAGHKVIGSDRAAASLDHAREQGLESVESVEELIAALEPPRTLWAMIPAGAPVDALLDAALPRLARGDLVVDGGNSNWRDSKRRGARLAEAGMMFA